MSANAVKALCWRHHRLQVLGVTDVDLKGHRQSETQQPNCGCILSVVIGRLGKSADSSFQFEPSDYGPKQKLVRFQSKEGCGRGGRRRPVELLDMFSRNYHSWITCPGLLDVVRRGGIQGQANNWNTTAARKSVRKRPWTWCSVPVEKLCQHL